MSAIRQTPASAPAQRILAAGFLLAVLALTVAPWSAGRADMRLLMEAYAFLALAMMWNMLAGYTGLVSVGQQAFVGLGGYVFFALAVFGGVPVLAAIPLAALITAAIALRQVAADWGTWYLILMGATAIAVLLIDKRGIWGAIKARTGLTLFPVNRCMR